MQQFKNQAEEPSSPARSSPGQPLGGSLNSLGMMPLPMRTKGGASDTTDPTGLGILGGSSSSKPVLSTEHGEVIQLGDLAGLSILNEAPLTGTEVSGGGGGGGQV